MLLALLLLAAPAAPPKTLAVLEFKSKLQQDDMDVGYITDVVRTAAKDAVPALKIITRENLLVLLGASGKKPEECEGDCEVETGRRVGADLVISGEALKFGSNYKINMKMHDTQSGELLSGAQATGADLDELDRNLHEAVVKLLAPVGATGTAGQVNEIPIPARAPQAGSDKFGFGAHASLGYRFDMRSSSSGGAQIGSENNSEYMYGLGADAEYRFNPRLGLGPFVEWMVFHYSGNARVPASSSSSFAFGALARFRAGPGALFAGVGYTTIAGDNGTGLLLELGGEIAIFGPLSARAALSYRSVGQPVRVVSFEGILIDEISARIATGEVGLGIRF